MHYNEQFFTQLAAEVSSRYPSSGIGEAVGTYIKDNKDLFSSDDEVGLLSLLFSKLLGDDSITPQQKNQLRQMVDVAMRRAIDCGDAGGGIVGETLVKSRLLHQEALAYFRIRSTDFDYFLVHPLSHPLANTIIRLECLGIVDQWRGEFQKSGKTEYRIEFFEDSSGAMGLWMSKKGIPFDVTKVG